MSPGFVETNALIALGISADAVALTLCDYEANARWRRALAWVCAVTLTHSLLPVAGLAGIWLASERLPAARTAFYVAGAAISALLLWRALGELTRSDSPAADGATGESALGFFSKLAVVSIDAALVGPGAAVATQGWTSADLLASLGLSLLFVGAILTCAAAAACWLGRRLGRRKRANGAFHRAARLGQCGVALPVFAYFVIASLAMAFAWPAPAITMDEVTDGDFSGNRQQPSAYALEIGPNPLIGTTVAGDLDYVSIEVPPGATLDAMALADFAGSDPIAFVAIQSGAVFTEPPTGTAIFLLLGYAHFGSGAGNVGTDILDDLGLGPGAIGFVPPLPAGHYTFWIQQINSAPTDYHFDLFVPEPAGTTLLGVGCVALAGLRRARGSAASRFAPVARSTTPTCSPRWCRPRTAARTVS